MEAFVEQFPWKYACAAARVLDRGYNLTFGGSGARIPCRTISFCPGRIEFDEEARPTLNPLFMLAEGRILHENGLSATLAPMFSTSEKVIEVFNQNVRGYDCNINTQEELFAKHLAAFFRCKIHRREVTFSSERLSIFNKDFPFTVFDFDSFRKGKYKDGKKRII